MSTKGTALLPMVLLSVCASVVASLVAVRLVSTLFGLTFHPSIIAVQSASASAAAIGKALIRQKHV